MTNTDKITIYEPGARSKTGLFRTWYVLTMNIIESHELIWQLFRRDFLMHYKKSFLGWSWIFISPVLGIVSWVFMNATGVLTPGDVGIPYPAYVLLSSSVFGLFMGFYQGALNTLTAGAGFILQVNFPHDTMLAKETLQQLASFAINFTVSIIVLLFFGVTPSWMLVLFPILIIPMFCLGAAIGLISSIISIVASDIQRAITFVMSLLMFITPVVYSPKVDDPFLQMVIKWNPLTYLIGGVRDAIIYGKIENFDRFLISSAISIVMFLLAWRLFYLAEEKVIEKMI